MQTTWNLSLALPDTSPENIAKLQKQSEKLITTFASKYSQDKSFLHDPSVLLQSLTDYENILATDPANQLGQYFGLSHALDQSNPELLSQLSILRSWSTTLANKIQFYTLDLAKISVAKQKEFLSLIALSHYHKFLARLFETAKYNLTEPEEKILNITHPFAKSNWVSLTARLLSEEKPEDKSLSQLLSDMNSIDKATRDKAAELVVSIFDKHKIVAEVEINNVVNYKKEIDTLRGVARPDLTRHISDDFETSSVDALRSAVVANFDIARDFYQLKAQLFGVKRLAYHERNVPYTSTEIPYSYEESISLVKKVFTRLDPEFAKVVLTYADSGQVDVYPHTGKQGGAFCTAGAKNTPGYVMLNHTNKLNDVLTLAHEFGHAINHEFMRSSNSAVYFDNSLAVAEVASTFFEDFVLDEVGQKANDDELLAIYMQKLNDDISTIFRQIACYEFEWELHQTIRQKGHLSWQEIGTIFQKNMAAYMGDYVLQGEGSNLFWVYWSHLRNHFYVYSYASGLLISKSLQALVKDNPTEISKVKTFLSTGTNASPAEIFQSIGLDISSPTFWQTGLSEVRTLLAKTRSLAIKLKKI